MHPLVWRGLLIAAVGDIVVPLFLGTAWADYRPLEMGADMLGSVENPAAVWYHRWRTLAGALFALAALGLYGIFPDMGGWRMLPTVLLLLYGVICAASGALGTRYPRNWVSVRCLGNGALWLIAPALAVLYRRQGRAKLYTVALISFAVCLLSLTVMVLERQRDGRHQGLWERVRQTAAYVPLICLGMLQLR